MKRTAIYSDDNRMRIISVSGQKWQFQELGTYPDSLPRAEYKHFDPWFNRGQATDDIDSLRLAMGGRK